MFRGEAAAASVRSDHGKWVIFMTQLSRVVGRGGWINLYI